MAKRNRINTVAEADEAMKSLDWLRYQGTPNRAVRDLWDCAAIYRAEVYRLQGDEGKGIWQQKVERKRG